MILFIYTLTHVFISLLGIGSGFVVLYGMLESKYLRRWTAFFLATTAATSVTGFFFPFRGFTPAYAFGILSLLILSLTCYSLYKRHLAGLWRNTYAISALIALYLNVFVLMVQLFQKIPHLKTLAPTQTETPFIIAQSVLLALFLSLGAGAVIRFRNAPTTQDSTKQ
jgi:hypothetical protein